MEMLSEGSAFHCGNTVWPSLSFWCVLYKCFLINLLIDVEMLHDKRGFYFYVFFTRTTPVWMHFLLRSMHDMKAFVSIRRGHFRPFLNSIGGIVEVANYLFLRRKG
jgi:hypothetical protein